MAYSEKNADRIRKVLVDSDSKSGEVAEVKMMGSLIFMVNGHMCCGATGERLMVRVGPDASDAMLQKPHVVPLDIGGGRAPRGFVCVEAPGYSTKRSLATWVNHGLSFVSSLPPKAPKKKKTRKKATTKKKKTGSGSASRKKSR